MTTLEITIIKDELRETAIIEYGRNTCTLSIIFPDGIKKTYTAQDIYVCFGLLRKEFSHITFLCKGAQINVMPSRMASQMSAGLVAYKMTMGKSATREDIVHIFDYEEDNLTNDPQEQIVFFKNWLVSLGAEDYEKFN